MHTHAQGGFTMVSLPRVASASALLSEENVLLTEEFSLECKT